MFERITPEQAGLSSKTILTFLKKLEKRGSRTHGFLMMKDGKIFTEAYWKPFNQDFNHRMYSQTKSFVGVAIGLLIEEEKLSLDDKVVDYFPEKIEIEVHEYLKNQTVRDMLTMSTVGGCQWWFNSGDPDRTHLYLNHERPMRPSGTMWDYDSAGSQVLCSLVEKLSGKPMLEYMKEKLFNKMGTFKNATILKCPNGDSWGDSAMVCTLRDIASFGQLVMNGGTWEGERLMNEAYLKEASSKLVDNQEDSLYNPYHLGYGYQIWRVCGNGFAFVGMGDQITVCYPDKNLIIAWTSDNQGTPVYRQYAFMLLEDTFVDKISNTPLKEDEEAQKELDEYINNLELFSVKGASDSPFRKELSGVEYTCDENPMGITNFSFNFNDETSGEFRYTNAQGDKVIPFGVNYNEFGKFPQYGYANDYGAVETTDGFLYDDAVSMAWLEEKKLMLCVQVIDRYFGNMSAIFAFKGDEVCAKFTKTAEYFMDEYQGVLVGKRK